MSAPDLSVDDAICIIVDQLKTARDQLHQYGYEIWLPKIIHAHLSKTQPALVRTYMLDVPAIRDLSTVFYAAGWELCRRGIVRPGVWRQGEQATENGQAGDGYTITPLGERWLPSADPLLFIPTEPSRLGAMLGGFASQFGAGFSQRAQEAARCYFATAYLACCAMSGAAAESILLAAAIARRGDEAAVLRDYRAAGGRGRASRRRGSSGRSSQSRIRSRAQCCL